MENSNLQILQRLLELAQNEIQYNEFPKSYKEEHMFLPNALNTAITALEHEFNEAFRYAVGHYKNNLKNGIGSWHNPEKLCYINMQINQLTYAVYGEKYVKEIIFNKKLGKLAYKDLIEQVDKTALMDDEEKKAHRVKCENVAKIIIERMKLKESIQINP